MKPIFHSNRPIWPWVAAFGPETAGFPLKTAPPFGAGAPPDAPGAALRPAGAALAVAGAEFRRAGASPAEPGDRRAGFGTIALSGPAETAAATGLIIIRGNGLQGTLVVQDLPMLPESQAYQLWLIKDGHPTSGGVFNVNENGYRAVWVVSEDPLASYTSFDITLEPADGSTYPTGRTFLND